MKNSLLRAIIKKYISFLIAMLLVSSLGCGIMSGMANGYLSLKESLDEFVTDMKYPDVVIKTKAITRDILDEIRAVPGVEAADARLAENLILVGNDGVYYSMQAMTYSEDEYQGTYYWERNEKESEYPVLLERRFAALNDIHAGDPVEVRAGDRSWDCIVDAVISRPEMIAHHKLGDMTMFSTDIGYVYIPDKLLKKIADADYESAFSEWEEGNKEYTEKKKDAEDEFDAVQAEIDDAEKLLKEKKEELDDQLKTAEEKKDELLKYKEEIISKSAELEEKEKELLEKKEELIRGEAELIKAQEEVASGEAELRQKKEELDSTKKTLESKRKELQDKLGELEKQEKELDKKKKEAQSAETEIEKGLQELADNEKQLIDAKEQALYGLALLGELRNTAMELKGYVGSIADFISTAEEVTDPYEWASIAVNQLDSILSETQSIVGELEKLRYEPVVIEALENAGISPAAVDAGMAQLYAYIEKTRDREAELRRLLEEKAEPEKIEAIRAAMVREYNDLMTVIESVYKLTDGDFDSLIARIDTETKKIEDTIPQIEDGLNQIAEGEKLLLEKQKEVQDGLSLIAEGEKQLQEGKSAISDGIKQIDDGLSQVASGYVEIDRYTKQIREAKSEIEAGRAELDEYERQYQEANDLLLETKEALTKALEDVENGIKEIDDAVKDGKQQLQDGEDELNRNKKDAKEQWVDFLKQSKEVEQEIDEARKELDEWVGYDEFCNEILLRFEPDADQAAALSEVEKVIGEDKVKESITYEDSGVKNTIDINLDPLEIMSIYVPMMFFLVSLIVEFLFMSFLIRQSRREIGILRALGFSRKSVIGLFCKANICVSIGAIILGLVIGYGVMRFIGGFFRNYFYLFNFEYVIYWERFWISVALTVLLGQIATIFSAGYISRIQPSEAMSRPAPAAAYSRENGILSRMNVSPFFKYCISSLLRNKGRLAFSIICLSSSVVLIFTAFSFDFSKNRILSEQFEDRIHYDCEIFFDGEPEEGFFERLNASGLVSDSEEVYYFSGKIESGGVVKEETIKGMLPDSKLIEIYDSDRKQLHVSNDGILLEKHTADPLKVTVGDTVMVDGKPMRITGIPEESDARFHYISSNSMQDLGSVDMYSIVCTVEKENEVPLMSFLSDEENYIYAAFTDRIFAGLEDGFQAFGISALIVLLFAVVIGSVIVINTIRTNLEEQKKDICVLRTLGFQYSGLSFRLMIQAAVYYVFACIIGVPCGIAVAKLVLKKMEIDRRSYPFVNDIRVYLFTLLLVLAYILISHFISMRAIKKWDLVETVKDKE